MASKGTPYQGRDLVIAPLVYGTSGLAVSRQLIAYCNTADSLSDSSVYIDLSQPTGTGYAPITLGGTWASSLGIVTYDHGVTLGFFNPTSGKYDPYWQNTHATNNWSLPVTGAAVIATVNGLGPYLLHFQDAASGITMTPKQRLAINASTLVAP